MIVPDAAPTANRTANTLDQRRANARQTGSPGARVWALTTSRLIAAIALLATGTIHLEQYIVADYRVIPTIGPLFLLNFIAGTVLGIYLLVPVGATAGQVRRTADLAVAWSRLAVASGSLIALLLSERTPLFGFMEHGYRVEILIAIGAEAVAILALSARSLRCWGHVQRGSAGRCHRSDPAPRATCPRDGTGLADMSHLSILTVPGLDVRSDWRGVHDRLLNEFPAVTDVLATTMPETLLIVHDDEPDSAWIDIAAATVLVSRRQRARTSSRRTRQLHDVVATGYHPRHAALESLPRTPGPA